MALEGASRELFEEIKYRRKFPPRETAASIKGEFAVRGLAQSSMLVQAVAKAYVEVVEQVLDEFGEAVIAKGGALGLGSDAEVRQVLATAHQQMFDEARGAVLDELGGLGGDYRTLAVAFVDDRRNPVWQHLERKLALGKLEEPVSRAAPKEREQKFGILLSPTQAARDFEAWAKDAEKWANPIAVLFVDLDRFRMLNERYTHTKVDQTILRGVQELLAKLVQFRGEAYRYGGEEFLLTLPNLDVEEAQAFAEKVRKAFEESRFEVEGAVEPVTVSIGLAIWPINGGTYEKVLQAANEAEVEAKKNRNTVKLAEARKRES